MSAPTRYIACRRFLIGRDTYVNPGDFIPDDMPVPNPDLWIRQGYIAVAPNMGATASTGVSVKPAGDGKGGGKKSGR